jgi:hypothetical protein
MEDIRTSNLRLVPYRIPPPKEDEYAWFNNGWFWRVYVDEQMITKLAVPFLATDRVIALWRNLQLPEWGSYEYISVRQAGNYVLWVDSLEKDCGSWRYSQALSGNFICFDVKAYARTIQQTAGEFQFHPCIYRSDDPAQQSLPRLTPRDLRQRLIFPETSYAIYRSPERDDDRWGADILRRVTKVIEYEELDTIRVSNPPAHYTELRIGFDEPPKFYESVWHIGKTEEGVAIRFIERPYFPVWLCGAAFDKALGTEPFLQART